MFLVSVCFLLGQSSSLSHFFQNQTLSFFFIHLYQVHVIIFHIRFTELTFISNFHLVLKIVGLYILNLAFLKILLTLIPLFIFDRFFEITQFTLTSVKSLFIKVFDFLKKIYSLLITFSSKRLRILIMNNLTV